MPLSFFWGLGQRKMDIENSYIHISTIDLQVLYIPMYYTKLRRTLSRAVQYSIYQLDSYYMLILFPQ